MSTVLVPDSSCLIALDWLDLLGLPAEVYTRVVVLEAVRVETQGRADAFEIATVTRAQRERIAARDNLLGKGECEVLAYCSHSIGLDTRAVIDDMAARRMASLLSVARIGTIGLLLEGKECGAIQAIRPLLNELERRDFFMSERLVAEALRLAGEA